MADFYSDWEAACRANRFQKAVATTEIEHKGKMQKVDVIKPLHGDAVICWANTGVRIRMATTKEVDSLRRWRPYAK